MEKKKDLKRIPFYKYLVIKRKLPARATIDMIEGLYQAYGTEYVKYCKEVGFQYQEFEGIIKRALYCREKGIS